MRFSKWLYPGMGVKRWLLVAWIGLTLFSLGFLFIINPHAALEMEFALVGILRKLTGQPVPPWVVDGAIMGFGFGLMIFGIQQWFESIYKAVVPHEQRKLVEVVFERRQLGAGAKIVAIGGGTGLSSLLRSIKEYSSNITAVVTVSDDGGSSGRLRKELGVLPPGDIRNCLVALADDESTLSELFNYRFTDGGGLEGHSFGNLFLAALTATAGGDFDQAVKLSSKILAIRGRVLPATLQTTILGAEYSDGSVVEGESEIPKHRLPIRRVFLKPADCDPQPEVLAAIREADLIIIGPGSLYTSLLPNLLVKGVASAIQAARAVKIYVCNVMTQPGETDGYRASDHLKAIISHLQTPLVDYCLLNDEVPQKLLKMYEAEGQYMVEADLDEIKNLGVDAIPAPLISETDLVRHDPTRLATAIRRIVTEKVDRQEGLLKLLDKSRRVA